MAKVSDRYSVTSHFSVLQYAHKGTLEKSGSFLRVASTEDLFDIIDNAHRVEGGHCGVKKTFFRVSVIAYYCMAHTYGSAHMVLGIILHRFRKYIKMCRGMWWSIM